jgi:hypothetical protein
MGSCLTCNHNLYKDIPETGFFDCGHPVTFDKRVRWQKGDPAMVDYRTGDVKVSEIEAFKDCPTFEPIT